MNKLQFRQAKKEDIDEIFSVYRNAVKEMERNNIFQWDEIYPNREILYNDIIKEQMYMGIINDDIASVYVINRECDKEYADGKWQYPNSNYCIIHRLCVNPKFQNQKVGTNTMQYIESQVKGFGFDSIRLDCFTLNPYACKMYQKLGYATVGYANWRKGRFYLMEKGNMNIIIT